MLGVRSVFVFIGIGTLFGSSNSLSVDTMGIYALARDGLAHLSPECCGTEKIGTVTMRTRRDQDASTDFWLTDNAQFQTALI